MTTRSFVALSTLLACIACAAVAVLAPFEVGPALYALLALAVLALSADLVGFLLPRQAGGSISFIPFMTMVLIAPNLTALSAIAITQALTEVARRQTAPKAFFNIAQLVLSYSVAILAFTLLGGTSLLTSKELPVSIVTSQLAIPLIVAYCSVFIVNTAMVSHVVALSTNTPTIDVWRENSLSTITVDLLALPLVFAFAWAFARFGPLLASALWLPLLGVRQMNAANLELARTNRELLELMIKSIEARDPYTSGHSRRVKEYAIRIARILGLGAAEVEKIGTAALLHDVGKIHEKYAPILKKEDRLSAEEWSVMKEHPDDGANLVATMSKLREFVPAVRHHHENWDGTGYPSSLKGAEIPLASRIIMFADTFDAMTTERPYRGPLQEDVVRAEIVRCKGKQFDPEIADRLLMSDFWSWLFPHSERAISGSTRLSKRLNRVAIAR